MKPLMSGHRHEIENKSKSIGLIDKYILGPVTDYLSKTGGDGLKFL